MAGLLGDVLPYLYSRGNALRRHVGGLLSDPVGSLEQTAGLLQDQHRETQRLHSLAFSDPNRPFRLTDQDALASLVDRTMGGPMGFAPVGMLGATRAQQVQEILEQLKAIPKGERVGLRMLPGDVPTPAVGSTLRPSMRWVDGVQTDKFLPGTSSIGLPRRDEASITAAISRLNLFDDQGWSGYYPGNKLAIISGASKRKGEDAGEYVIPNALVRYLTDPPLGPR